MKILVYTGFNQVHRYARMGEISSSQKLIYANKHNYDFLVERNYSYYDRHISWYKIAKIAQFLPYYDYIFWTDADVQIKNFDVKLEDIINSPGLTSCPISPDPVGQRHLELPNQQNGHFILSTDEHGPCMAAFFVKRSDWSMQFLHHIYLQTQYLNDGWWDQRAAHFLWSEGKFTENLQILKKNVLHSSFADYKEGDFLIHDKF